MTNAEYVCVFCDGSWTGDDLAETPILPQVPRMMASAKVPAGLPPTPSSPERR